MSLATATAIHFLFQPVPPGVIRMDEMYEIALVSKALNVAFPFGIAVLIYGSILSFRRAVSPLALALLGITFLAVVICTLELWKTIAGRYGPTIDLWANHIWWYVGK
jgi:hypothetical protein